MAVISLMIFFNYIFSNENIGITIKILLKYLPKGAIDNISLLVQIMAWHRPHNKPLSEKTIASLLHDAYMRHLASWEVW